MSAVIPLSSHVQLSCYTQTTVPLYFPTASDTHSFFTSFYAVSPEPLEEGHGVDVSFQAEHSSLLSLHCGQLWVTVSHHPQRIEASQMWLEDALVYGHTVSHQESV